MFHFWSSVNDFSAFSGMTLDSNTGIFINTTQNGYLLEAQTMLASAVALIAWVYRFRLLALVPFAAFFVLRAGTGGRGPLVASMAMLILLYFFDRRQKFPNIRLILLVAIGLSVFTFIGVNRGAEIRYVLGLGEKTYVENQVDEKFLEGMDFGNLEFFEYIVYVVPQRSGTYDYFLDNLQLLTEPIPRALWTDKPVGPPIQRVNLLDYGRPNGMTRSLPGEGWYAWGGIGVMIWCGLWGAVLGRIYQGFAAGPQNSLHTATYMVFLPILIVAFRDGSIVTVFRQGVFYFFPLVLWFAFSRYMGLPTARTMRFAAYRKWRSMKAKQLRRPELLAGSDPSRMTTSSNPARRY